MTEMISNGQDEEWAIALEVFDRIATHLLKQGERAAEAIDSDGFGPCMYRTSTGLRCAVGGIIDDASYDPLIEGVGINGCMPLDGAWAPRQYRSLGHGEQLQASAALLARVLNESKIPASKAVLRVLVTTQSIHDCHRPESWKHVLDQNRLELVRNLSSLVVV